MSLGSVDTYLFPHCPRHPACLPFKATLPMTEISMALFCKIHDSDGESRILHHRYLRVCHYPVTLLQIQLQRHYNAISCIK